MKRLVLILVLSSLTCAIHADDNRALTLEIKKSDAFIYGEAAGSNMEEIGDIAFEKLLTKTQDYLSAFSKSVTPDELKSKTNMVSYMRGPQIAVILYYVNKQELLGKPSDETTQPVLVEPYANGHVNQVKDYPSVYNGPDLSNQEESQIESKIALVEEVADINDGKPVFELGEKENAVISPILQMRNYQEIKDHLKNRHDVVSGLTKSFDGYTDCFWVIMDNDRNILAVIAPNESINLMDGERSDLTSFRNHPKMWIQIIQ